MNTYLFTGSHPQFVTINGAGFEMHPNNTVELPDCDYVQTLVAKAFLTPVDAPVDAPVEDHAEEAQTEEVTAEAQDEAQTDSQDVEAPAKKSAKKGAQE
jgi:hypothetical protein